MKRILGKLGIGVVLLIALAWPVCYAFAQSGTGVVTTGYSQNMMQAEVQRYRSTTFSYVLIKADSVRPALTWLPDAFTNCGTRIYQYNTNALPISNVYTLSEGAGYYHIVINEGYLNIYYYDICFSSPSYLPAIIDYGYDGL